LIKYIKSVLWRVAKCLSYIEEARCLKVKENTWNREKKSRKQTKGKRERQKSRKLRTF
jgi:hypothetical protein